MLLSLTTTHRPATDLGYLLRKNPGRPQAFDLSFGTAHVFYPEATEDRCTCVLLVEIDPIGLVRNRKGPAGEGLLDQYVNDRPYAASSFLSVAIAEVFGSALSAASKERPELVDLPIPLEAELPVVPCRGGADFLKSLFEPLGYTVAATQLALDEKFPAWGASRFHQVRLSATVPLHALLSHLYVLLPVLDNDKHYWVTDDEVQKLLRHGEGWLAAHPQREIITRRYLKHQRSLFTDALARLNDESDPAPDEAAVARAQEEADIERSLSLNEQRMEAVLAALLASNAQSVLDLGCGEGRLLKMLLKERAITRVVGLDVAHRALESAAGNLNLERLPPMVKEKIQLLHGSLMYRDARLTGFDAASVVEVIEHLDPPRLAAFERVLFEFAHPGTVVLTTPNSEYNVKWETLPAGRFRIRTIALNGTAPSSRLGHKPSPSASAIACVSLRWGPRMRWSARPHRWPSFPGENHHSRAIACRPDRRVRFGQKHIWPTAFQADRDSVVRLLPGARVRRREQPSRHLRRV